MEMLSGYSAFPAMESHLVRRSPDPRIQSTFAFIAANLDRRIRLIDLARLSGLSAARFSHLFALATGMTPGKYMRELRAQQAASASSPLAVPSRLARRPRSAIRYVD
jgi:transcriptional regulator GlxA family with amidase domain